MSKRGVRVQGMVLAAKVFGVTAGLVLAAAVSVTRFAGCESFQLLEQRASQATGQASTMLNTDRDYWQREYNEAVALGDTLRATHASDRLRDIERAEQDLASVTSTADKLRVRVTDEDGNFDTEKVAREASLYLPYPFNLISLVGVPLIVGGVQEWRRRQAIKSEVRKSKEIIASVDAARKNNPIIADMMSQEDTKTVMWEQLSPETYDLINAWRNT